MTKKEFLTRLRRSLSSLGRVEVKDSLSFYGEIIDDKIEEGFSECDAVASIGDIEEIVAQILKENGIEKKPEKRKSLTSGQVLMLILGFPVWLPLLIAGIAVMWSLEIAIWAVEIPLFILSIISKYLLIACIESGKLFAKITKKCVTGILGRLMI